MSKYTKEQLKHMAMVVMFNPMSDKGFKLILTIASITGLHPEQVKQKITDLTEGERL